MEHSHTITLSNLLLHFSRPLTASTSLPFLSTPPPRPPHHSTDHRILTTLNRPTVIVGTLTLPTHTTPSSSHFPCSCFKFSDGSATLCCDILSFRLAAVGKQIRVTAWNFIPFKHPGNPGSKTGLLEIIKWCFSNPNDESNFADLLPVKPNFPVTSCSNGGKYFRAVHGLVKSVGPISIVPCATPANSSYDLNSSSKVNFLGFLVELLCCECRLCGSRDLVNNLKNGSFQIENMNGHSFTKMEILYFCGNASSFHPVMTKLIGNRVVVLGLKKKLVCITKEESCLMFLTLDEMVLRVCPRLEKLVPSLKSEIKGKGECGCYTGLIRAVHMKGMALELDNDVWLLLTDQLHTMIHGLRVGSIISVRNVHFVDPKFSWTKVVILGACVKTSIIVESFSPLETVCNVVLQSTSMLGKFIQSLPFSARLWVLLLVSSLRKKFADSDILSDKDILGSKHQEGLAQMHASSLLPPSVFLTQHGAFMGLCRHDFNGCGREMHCGFLKLVVPMSIFIHHCINTLQRALKSESPCKFLSIGNHLSILPRPAKYNGRSGRRIISSEDVGVGLLGYLKIDPLTRRLQLVDATGGIDVLIPDLPLTWNSNDIFEVTNYDIIMDGVDKLVDQLGCSESLSCKMIFNCIQVRREFSTSVSVYCLWKNVKCRNFPIYPCINSKNETKILESGSYHLLRVSHKFPPQEKQSNNVRSIKSSTFVEAILLPYILLLDGKPGISHPCNVYGDKTIELSKYCFIGNNEEQVFIKRQKLIEKSVNTSKDEFHTSVYQLNACSNTFRENTNCDDLSSLDISCMVTFRDLKKENVVCPALLRSTSLIKDMCFNSKPTTPRKILLEFSSDRFLKYRLLQIGGYYVIKHNAKDCFSTSNDAGFGSSGSAKFVIDYGKHIWSLALICDDVHFNNKSVYASVEGSSPHATDGVMPKVQIEQQLLSSNDDSPGFCSDVCLYLPVNLTGLLEDNIMESEVGQIQKFATSEQNANICFNIGTALAWPNFFSGPQSSNCLFPEGKLISLKGNVVDIHDLTSSLCNSCSSESSLDVLQMKGLVGTRGSFCIHVSVDNNIVNIYGSISKDAFPTGFGPGSTATFHRILDARAQNFMLLPVSFIEINSIEVFFKQCSDRLSSTLRPLKDVYSARQDSFSCLISQLPQCPSQKQIVLRCRVVAVTVLVLEMKARNLYAETKVNSKGILLDIPLACFVLDDGSSLCCCWVNAERAATLLRLQEEATTSYQLGRILKKYKRVTVKNRGSFIDFPYQDLVVSVASGDALNSSDENIIKYIIFNACVGRTWNVVGSVMDSEEVTQLKNEYLTHMVNMQPMQSIWANEATCSLARADARNMIQELLKS
ncbi:unnamed protein product [Trifolium pratense]|uniref:Uncharacterized protein n=1 Tax=Trifolium pratense TaxID=57577 RepID=A0ACB0KIC2_TRIPR|nr:unnamed protein product [Trifolium pratense]